MKKLFTFFLALITSAGTMFANPVKIGDLYYNLDATNQTAEVTSMAAIISVLNIPSNVSYNAVTYRVTSIGEKAFYSWQDLKSVTIPNSVTSIGKDAFYNCTNLTSVTIPSSVTNIGDYAFSLCKALTSIEIPNSVTSIGDWAFSYCYGLTSVTIPNNVTRIGNYAFSSCNSLTSVTIPNSVTSIGYGAFRGCSGLTSFEIPNSVTSIGGDAFDGVPNISYSGTATGSPWGAKCINGYVENYLVFNSSLKDTLIACSTAASEGISIPNGVKYIKDKAFYRCSGLTSITIPNSVTHIGESAFYDCSNLTSITIPDGVTSIENSTFEHCTSLTSVTLGSGVTSIGYHAFCECSSLTSIDIPNSVISIGNLAFENCTSLTSVTLGSGVTDIGNFAFSSCGCSLTSIMYNSHIFVYMPSSYSGTYDIPNGIESIASNAFSNCSGLTSITIPSSVTNIGSGAFSDCTGLTSIEIPNSVTSIGSDAFNGCTGLNSIVIPNSITSIKLGTFEDCAGLTSVTIPNSVTSIGYDAFNGCSGLTSMTVPNSVVSIGDYAFENINNIIYDGTATGSPWGAKCVNGYVSGYLVYSDFSKTQLCGCSTRATGKIIIPNSVTSILKNAFLNCKGLTSVIIGSNVSTIGENAFYNCDNLSTIYSLPIIPPTIETYTFHHIPSDAKVYVSEKALSNYKSASIWGKMKIIGIEATAEISEHPTDANIKMTHDFWIFSGDYISSVGIEDGETFDGSSIELIGLEPNTEYTKTFVLTSNTGDTETISVSFKTTELELTTQPSKPVSSNTAILLAATNMSDAEVSCGFEWKRNDAPEDMAGNQVFTPVANGTMAGRLKGLKEDVYYKYRAFYQSAAGNMYYGDWQYIFTGDNTVEFDPVLYTYAPVSVGEEEATLKGYAIAGSDDFTEQGFEYWADSRVPQQNEAPRHMPAALGEHMTVQAEGISMKVTLTDLDPGTVYKYRTYAKIGDKMLYGAEMSFTTKGEYIEEEGGEEGGEEALESLSGNAAPFATKLLRNGQILILRGSRTYTLTGQEVK